MSWISNTVKNQTKKRALDKAGNHNAATQKTTQAYRTFRAIRSAPKAVASLKFAAFATPIAILLCVGILVAWWIQGLLTAAMPGTSQYLLSSENCVPLITSESEWEQYLDTDIEHHPHTGEGGGQTGAPVGTVTSGAQPTTPVTTIVIPSQGFRLGGAYVVTSNYGPRSAPVAGASTWHKGTDFRAPRHHPILATADGVVSKVIDPPVYSQMSTIEIRHLYQNSIITSVYRHMDSIDVKAGDTVTAGQKIGGSGNRGPSSAPHLHFEIWLGTTDESHTNPLQWLTNNNATVVYAAITPGENINLPPNPNDNTDINSPIVGTDPTSTCDASSTGSEGTQAGAWGGWENGKIPADQLSSPASHPNVKLRQDAAAALEQLNTAYTEHFGKNLTITDHYRDYAGQVKCREEKGNLCAVPGTSNHGWGLAIDFGGGINNFGTEEHQWMRDNAHRYGWNHPQWAQQNGSKPEPWHWEYGS